MSRLDLVAGPNGGGKSTFVRSVLAEQLRGTPSVDVDAIARYRWPEDPEGHAYEAATVAQETRSALIRSGDQFIAETVFSHTSKLDLIDEAQGAGYFVALHVLMVPVLSWQLPASSPGSSAVVTPFPRTRSGSVIAGFGRWSPRPLRGSNLPTSGTTRRSMVPS